MFELYQGLSFYRDNLYATFTLSEPVRKGFNVNAYGVSKEPAYVSIQMGIIEYAFFADGYLIYPELGIRLDENALRQIMQVAKDAQALTEKGRALPPVPYGQSVILG